VLLAYPRAEPQYEDKEVATIVAAADVDRRISCG
jgi:hypothetical protein